MPATWFPEQNTALPSDGENRSAQKWNSLLYDSVGPKSLPCFPEGTQPLASDDIERSLKKIDTLLGGGSSGPSHHTGHGSPEGVVSACVGDTYTDLDTGLNWTKTSGGCTSTGWTPQYSDNPANYANLVSWVGTDFGVNGATNGNPISTWTDRSPAAQNWIRGSFTAPKINIGPTYTANFSGSSPAALFAGTGNNSLMLITARLGNLFTIVGDFTFILAYSAAGDGFPLASINGNYQSFRVKRSGANVISCTDGTTEVISSALTQPANDLRMLTIRRNGGSTFFYEGTVAKGSAGGMTLPMQLDSMGWVNDGGAGEGTSGGLFEMCAYQTDIGVPAINSLCTNYFRQKYPTMTTP